MAQHFYPEWSNLRLLVLQSSVRPNCINISWPRPSKVHAKTVPFAGWQPTADYLLWINIQQGAGFETVQRQSSRHILPRAFSWLCYSGASVSCHSGGQTLHTSFSAKPLLCHACRLLKDGATLSIGLPWRRVCRTLTTPSGRLGSRGNCP